MSACSHPTIWIGHLVDRREGRAVRWCVDCGAMAYYQDGPPEQDPKWKLPRVHTARGQYELQREGFKLAIQALQAAKPPRVPDSNLGIRKEEP